MDLRTVLGEPVEVEFDMVHCGAGVLDAGRSPRWLPPGQRLAFVPGFLDNDFRATYQQLLDSAPR